ncbi:MAG: sensor histidine kinase, partial [Pseudomonadota bacterium]
MTLSARLPLTIKVPALVVLLMVIASAAISERVMSRLIETQERHLQDLAESYLDGLSSSLVPHVLRDDIWEVFDTLDRSQRLYGAIRPIETVVT